MINPVSHYKHGVPEMHLTYRGTAYEVSTTEGLELVEVKGATHHGIPYTSYQAAPSTPTQPANRRVYRGRAY